MPSITLVEYDPEWPALFEQERRRILDVAGEYIEDVQHVGSTSVPALGAKPVIDIMIGLRDFALVERCIGPLEALGYEYLGENGIPDRHFFRNPPGQSWEGRKFNVHMVKKGDYEWRRHILFRDYLRAHLEAAQEYYALKQALAARYADNPDAYMLYPDAKTDFVASILSKAGFRAENT